MSAASSQPARDLRAFLTQIVAGGAATARAVQAYVDVCEADDDAFEEFGLNDVLDPEPDPKKDPRRITGITAVGLLCRHGETEALRRLLAFVASQPPTKVPTDLNKGRGTSSPLLLAAAFGHAGCIRVLLDSNRVNVNKSRRDGVSALTIACQQGHVDIVKLLCACPRLQVNKRTLFPERVTPCLLAIRAGREDVLRLLLAHPRFDLQENKFGGSKSGQSAIEVAEALGELRMAEMLRAHEVEMQTSVVVSLDETGRRTGTPPPSQQHQPQRRSEQQDGQQRGRPFDVEAAFFALTQRVTILETENRNLIRRLASVEARLCNGAVIDTTES